MLDFVLINMLCQYKYALTLQIITPECLQLAIVLPLIQHRIHIVDIQLRFGNNKAILKNETSEIVQSARPRAA